MNFSEPFVAILIGTPLSGKSTYVRDNFLGASVISRDEILMEVFGSRDYNLAFQSVDQKEVDRVLDFRLKELAASGKSVVIDMTNLTPRRRRHNLSYFSNNYHKVAIIFPQLSDEEYEVRNQKRSIEEGKTIPLKIIKEMMINYKPPQAGEGFNQILYL
jgi:predicted kinase